MDVDEDVVTVVVVVVVVEGIFDTMEFMVVIIQIPRKGKPVNPRIHLVEILMITNQGY